MSKHEIVSTFDVEDAYVFGDLTGASEEGLRAAFQTWLREIRASVWDEGWDAGTHLNCCGSDPTANPYREA